jgi:hypothetical protein
MCGNRVEELESRVKELEASVEGLTDELVECKVRIRELEGAFEDEIGFVPEPEGTQSEETVPDESESEMIEPGDADAAETADAAEASKGEASETADTESDSDIIIA